MLKPAPVQNLVVVRAAMSGRADVVAALLAAHAEVSEFLP